MLKRDDVAFVSDLDGTLTPRTSALMWRVNTLAMPPEAGEDVQRVIDTFLKPMIAGTLPPEQEPFWILGEVDNYVRHRLTREAWQAAIRTVVFREGALEALHETHALGVPHAIISFGVADMIEYLLEHHGIRHLIDRIYALRLIHDERGVVVGCDPTTLTCPTNKGDRAREFAEEMGVPYEALIGRGDSLGDRNLGPAHRRIGIAESQEDYDQIAPHMHQVFMTPHFGPVHDLTLRLAGLAKP